jgi:hypothetical protein
MGCQERCYNTNGCKEKAGYLEVDCLEKEAEGSQYRAIDESPGPQQLSQLLRNHRAQTDCNIGGSEFKSKVYRKSAIHSWWLIRRA